MQKVQLQNLLENYINDVQEKIAKTDFSSLAQISEIILNAKERGTTIFTIGNGGSAATASHICNDLLKGCAVCGHTGFKAECLCDSSAVITCLSNDFDYESVFSIQLETKAKAGDVVVAYSGSGNSPNIIKGLLTAKKLGLTTIGLSGRDGGKMKELCDVIVIAPTEHMGQIEDFHCLYSHALSSVLASALTERYSK